jgi:hypothetical protein
MLRSILEGQSASVILERMSSIENGLTSIRENLQQRAAILLQPA